MKRALYLLALVIGLVFVSLSCVFAAPQPAPILTKAQIDVIENADLTTHVSSAISLADAQLIKNGKLEFTVSRINDTDIQDLAITVNGQKAVAAVSKGKALTRVAVPYENSGNNVEVTAKYTVPMQKDKYEVPMLVPIYPSLGRESVVTINITAPEGTYIHSNCFPVVPHMQEGNREVVPTANIPSHVKFEFSKEPEGLFNEFSTISYAVFLALVAIVVKWVHSEMQN